MFIDLPVLKLRHNLGNSLDKTRILRRISNEPRKKFFLTYNLVLRMFCETRPGSQGPGILQFWQGLQTFYLVFIKYISESRRRF